MFATQQTAAQGKQTSLTQLATQGRNHFENFDQFQEFVRRSFIDGSGIDPKLFNASVEFHQDVEATPGNDVTTPIHDILGWEYKRFRHQANEPLYAAFLMNEDGTVWQAVLSLWDEEKQRPYQYLAPKGNGDRAFLPPVPESIRKRIGQRYGVEVPLDGSFWEWLEETDIPRIATEGGKKGLCGLSQGYVTIALYGCSCGAKHKNEVGIQIDPYLIADLERFALPESRWLTAFDRDYSEKAKLSVAAGKKKLTTALKINDCHCVDIKWKPEQGKGLDDLVMNSGSGAFDKAYQDAIAQLERQFKESLGDPNKPDEAVVKNFLMSARDQLYGDKPWICVDNKLYSWQGTYYKYSPDSVERPRIVRWLEKYRKIAKPAKVDEILKWVKYSTEINPELVNPPGINCTNGVVSVKWDKRQPIKTFSPHDPNKDYYLYEPLIKYDPQADPRDCDRLLNCLDQPQKEVLLRNLAASIDLPTVRKFRGRDVKLLLACGLGANGKDALRQTVSTIFGHTGMTSVSLADFAHYDDGRKFGLAPLLSSRVNWASENPQTARLDKIQSLKLFATGNTLHSERKGKDHIEFTPKAVGIFNLNETPSLQGVTQAIKDRLAVIEFRKTFTNNPNPNDPNELLADPRFAYDDEFIRCNVAPAFLNKMFQALSALVSEGVDYRCTSEAFRTMQKENNHIMQFCEDVGLGYDPNTTMTAMDIWQHLEEWYQANGTLTIEDGKRIWVEQAKASDKNVKAVNQVLARFKQLFPKAKLVTLPHKSGKKVVQALQGISINAMAQHQVEPEITFNHKGGTIVPPQQLEIPPQQLELPPQLPPQKTTQNQDFHPTHPSFLETGEKVESGFLETGEKVENPDFGNVEPKIQTNSDNPQQLGWVGCDADLSSIPAEGTGVETGVADSSAGVGEPVFGVGEAKIEVGEPVSSEGTTSTEEPPAADAHGLEFKAKLNADLIRELLAEGDELLGELLADLLDIWSEEQKTAVKQHLLPQEIDAVRNAVKRYKAFIVEANVPNHVAADADLPIQHLEFSLKVGDRIRCYPTYEAFIDKRPVKATVVEVETKVENGKHWLLSLTVTYFARGKQRQEKICGGAVTWILSKS